MDYKPSKEIRNIRKLHTCKNLNLNVLYLFKNYHTCTHFQNSSEKLRETDFDRQIKVITFLGETPRNFTEKFIQKLSYMYSFSKFLRETPRNWLWSTNQGNYLSRRNTEKFHRETPRNFDFAQTILSTWLISRCFSEKWKFRVCHGCGETRNMLFLICRECKSLDEFEIQPDPTTGRGVICPWAFETIPIDL